MKKTTLFTSLALGAVLVAAAPAAFAECAMSGGCCGVTPMADSGKSDAKTDSKAKAYPLDTCIVSGEKLGEMGDPFVFTHEGQEIKLCCKSCKKKFDKSPETYLKKLKDAPAKK